MRFATTDTAYYALAPSGDPVLNAFIVYEDVRAAKHAKESCDRLAAELGGEWTVEIEMSSFDSLQVPHLQNIATGHLISANIVIFACDGRYLPFEVWQWTESLLRDRGQPAALVAHLGAARCQSRQPLEVEMYLAGLAQRRGMQFFTSRNRFNRHDSIREFAS
jgi:hypothetical protein